MTKLFRHFPPRIIVDVHEDVHTSFREIMFHKPCRVESRATISAVRKPVCEKCGKPAYGEPHHIFTRGAGYGDVRENLIQLCGECHAHAHAGKIKPAEFIVIVAVRESISFERCWELARTSRDKVKYLALKECA